MFGSVGYWGEDHDSHPQRIGQYEFYAFVRQSYSDAYAESECYGYSRAIADAYAVNHPALTPTQTTLR